MITILCHDGEKRELEIEPTLATMQSLVGGLIEAVPGHPNVWCNEEGRIHKLPINEKASKKYGQVLFGQVVIAELE
jgi:hypothetical protein